MQASKDQLKEAMLAVLRLVGDTQRATAEAFDPTWLGMLRLVASRGPIPMVELMDVMDARPTSVRRNLQTLAEDKLVTLTEDPDGRGRLVGPTEAGIEELRQIHDTGVDFFAAVIRGWTADGVCTLYPLATGP